MLVLFCYSAYCIRVYIYMPYGVFNVGVVVVATAAAVCLLYCFLLVPLPRWRARITCTPIRWKHIGSRVNWGKCMVDWQRNESGQVARAREIERAGGAGGGKVANGDTKQHMHAYVKTENE